MKIAYIHYYVKNLAKSRQNIFDPLGFQVINQVQQNNTYTEILSNGFIYFILSEAIHIDSPVFDYLQCHPSGVVDIAFEVNNIEYILKQALEHQVEILQSIQSYLTAEGMVKYCQISSWGCLTHTIIENSTAIPSYLFPLNIQHQPVIKIKDLSNSITTIDHVVLNVHVGELEKAANWYNNVFNFQFQQSFNIQTNQSGLHSICLKSPQNNFWFNINIPSSNNSQIQEFLDCNQSAGIQHIALGCQIIPTVQKMRSLGLCFLEIPAAYYHEKRAYLEQSVSLPISLEEYQNLENLQILIDWQNYDSHCLLLQIFTQPIFEQPTFFFELIERRKGIQGFGNGNFQALFEAMEKEQIKRRYMIK